MEIIDEGPWSDDDLVPIAFAETREEAALIRGLLREADIRSLVRRPGADRGYGPASAIGSSPRRIYVRPDDAARARTLLAETMVEDPLAEEVPEPANAEYLADATGHRPRDYSVLGAYGRAWTVAIAVLAVTFVVLLLLK